MPLISTYLDTSYSSEIRDVGLLKEFAERRQSALKIVNKLVHKASNLVFGTPFFRSEKSLEHHYQMRFRRWPVVCRKHCQSPLLSLIFMMMPYLAKIGFIERVGKGRQEPEFLTLPVREVPSNTPSFQSVCVGVGSAPTD